jgi:hypothetical protein
MAGPFVGRKVNDTISTSYLLSRTILSKGVLQVLMAFIEWATHVI